MNQPINPMKKIIILAAIIPSLIFGQRSSSQLDKIWEKEIIKYRSSNGPSLSRSPELDSAAKERFLRISNSLKKSEMGILEFFSEFGKGKHGIPKIGLEPFAKFAGVKFPGKEIQEICASISFSSSPSDEILDKNMKEIKEIGGFFDVYKRSEAHWWIASGNIPMVSIERKYNGRLHKWSEVQKPIVVHNSKFGSYSGIAEIEENGVKKSVVINVSIFE